MKITGHFTSCTLNAVRVLHYESLSEAARALERRNEDPAVFLSMIAAYKGHLTLDQVLGRSPNYLITMGHETEQADGQYRNGKTVITRVSED